MQIVGTGAVQADQPLTSAQIDARLGKPEGWTFAASGVATRAVMTRGSQIDMALAAAQTALSDAGLRANQLDLIVSACGIPYQTLPSTAPLVQRGLGLGDGAVAGFDVNSTCLSFLTALDVVQALMAAGRYRAALIVSSEVASRALPWDTQPDVAALFADGAAAAVVVPGPGAFTARFRTFPSGYEACQIGAGGTRFDYAHDRAGFDAHSTFQMDGRALFRLTAQHFGGFVQDLLDEAGVTRDQISCVIPHQASPGALQHMIRLCGFDPARVVDLAATFGNQIAASLPTALDHARRSGMQGKGLLLGTSAGVSFGGIVMDI